MSSKKEKILAVALELFANEGYSATSTSKIAKEAGVSEGLIFRHFESKKGLLEAIMVNTEERLNEFFTPILFEKEPKEVIRKVVNLPFGVGEEEFGYWKLQYKLKWNKEYNNPDKLKPFLDKLSWAFSELGYEDPEEEAILLQQILEMISINVLRDENKPALSYYAFLSKKYNL